jgi:GT2 family glycosyltransferase/SAM-dependent methyltransferase
MAYWFSTYGKTMGELIRREAATAPLPFVGERLTAAISGQIEIEHYHRYLLAREFCRDLDVVDVASGEGYGTALLAQVAKSAIGIEIDPETVVAARAEFQHSNLRYEQGDVRKIPLADGSVDVAVSFETLEHIKEQDVFLSELRRVLRPDGLLIISTPDRDIYSPINVPPNPYHARELTRAEFEAVLARHFSCVALAAQRAILGSVIISNANDVPARSYEKRSDTLIEGGEHLMRAPYLVALASNVALPPLPNSVYIYRSDLDTDFQSRLAAEEKSRVAERQTSEAQESLARFVGRAAEAAKESELAYQEQARERESLLLVISQANERILQKEADHSASLARIADLEHELPALLVARQEQVREYESLLQAISQANERIVQKEADHSVAMTHIADLERELSTSAITYQERERQISLKAADAAQNENNSKQALGTAHSRIEELEGKVAASALALQQGRREVARDARALETERGKLESRITNLENSLIKASSNAQAAAAKLIEYAEANVAVRAQIKHLEFQLLAADRRASEWQVREAAAAAKLIEYAEANVAVRAQIKHLEFQLLAADRRASEGQVREAAAAAKLIEYAEANVAVRAQIKHLEFQLLAAEGRASEGQLREANARAHIGSLEQKLSGTEGDRDGWIRQASALTERLSAIERSTAWRASGPLRRVGRRFPKLARLAGRTAKIIWWTATFQIFHRYTLWRARQQLSKDATPPISAPSHLGPARRLQPVIVAQSSNIEIPDRLDAAPPSGFELPCSPTPAVSIIISTYGQLKVTLDCLKSIADHAPLSSIEVIVVDDAYAGPENMSDLEKISGIKFLRNTSNLGFLLSCNSAAKRAKGSFLYFLNNDTVLQPGAIDALVSLLEARPDAGMVGSKLIFPDGKLQEAGGIIWKDATGWNYGRGDDPNLSRYNYVREVDYCSGASIMVRRQLFELLGGFDEIYAPAYYEDADLAFRIRAQGLKVLYEPKSVVVHYEGVSHGTDVNTGVKSYQLLNQTRFYDRWKAVLEAENYSNAECVVRARDRARARKMILVIDHYVPEPDRDAGSRSTMGIIDSLVDANWVVKFWPHNRAYHAVYTAALERRGIEVLDGRFAGNLSDWLSNVGKELDHLLVSRPDVATDVLASVTKGTNAVLSFYGHDLHFQRMRRQANLENDKELHSRASKMERLERDVWTKFDVVLYPSEDEAAIVRQMSPRALARGIVPFCFDSFPARTNVVKERSILFVAGFAHPPNVDAANFLIREIVPLLETDVGPITITLAGSNPTDSVKNLAGSNVKVTGYVSEETLGELYETHRVSVVPLRFGAGVKGKVVEALSRGLPLVTTSIGAEGIPELDTVVPVRDDAADIADALKLLLTDDVAWMSQSQQQMQFAQLRFSRKAMQLSVLSALEAGERAREAKRATADRAWERMPVKRRQK